MAVRNERNAESKWRGTRVVEEFLWVRKREVRAENTRRKRKGKQENASLSRRTRIENERWLARERRRCWMSIEWVKWEWIKASVVCILNGTRA